MLGQKYCVPLASSVPGDAFDAHGVRVPQTEHHRHLVGFVEHDRGRFLVVQELPSGRAILQLRLRHAPALIEHARHEFAPREPELLRRGTVQEHCHLDVLRHARTGEVAAGDDEQLPGARSGTVALHVHQAFAVDDVDLDAAVEQLRDHLPAGQLLPRAAGEDGHNLAAVVDVIAEYRIEPDAAVVVGESRNDVHGAVAGRLFPQPESLEHRQQPRTATSGVHIGMDRQFVHGCLRNRSSVSCAIALFMW